MTAFRSRAPRCRALAALALLIAFVPAAFAAEAPYAPGELLVRFRPAVAADRKASTLAALDAELVADYARIGVQRVERDGDAAAAVGGGRPGKARREKRDEQGQQPFHGLHLAARRGRRSSENARFSAVQRLKPGPVGASWKAPGPSRPD